MLSLASQFGQRQMAIDMRVNTKMGLPTGKASNGLKGSLGMRVSF